jgi:tetratricopeptide (TPR) repeat protein
MKSLTLNGRLNLLTHTLIMLCLFSVSGCVKTNLTTSHNPERVAPTYFREGLAPVYINGKCGYAAPEGMVLSPKYSECNYFSNGKAGVQLDGRWVIINKQGTVIKKAYTYTGKAFRDGLAIFEKDGKCGYINSSGKTIIAPQFEDAGHFKKGLAPAKKKKWGLINKKGQFVIPPKYDSILNFRAGLAPFLNKGKWGFLNNKGKIAIPNTFDGAKHFYEDLAAVQIGGKWGYIDKAGNIVVRPQYIEAYGFSGSTATVSLRVPNPGSKLMPYKWSRRKLYKIENKFYQGSEIISDGMDRIKDSNDKYGFLKDGKIVVKPQFEDIRSCYNGLCPAKKDGKYSFIDYSGRAIIKTDFTEMSDYHCGLYRVKINSKYGFINSSGTIIIPTIYDSLDENACYPELKSSFNLQDGILKRSKKWSFFSNISQTRFLPQTNARRSPKITAKTISPIAPIQKNREAQVETQNLTKKTNVKYKPTSKQSIPLELVLFPDKSKGLIDFKLRNRKQFDYPIVKQIKGLFKFKPKHETLVPARHPIAVDIFIKKNFSGKIQIYSTDMRNFILLNKRTGEYVKSITYDINSQVGKFTSMYIGFIKTGNNSEVTLGAEVLESRTPQKKKYYAKIINKEIMDSPPTGDWYANLRLGDMFFMGEFASTRARKLLASDKSKALTALPQLIDWLLMDKEHHSAAKEGIDIIIKTHGCQSILPHLSQLLKNQGLKGKRKYLKTLQTCGPEAKSETDKIEMFFEDTNTKIRKLVFTTYKKLGFKIPLKYTPLNEINPDKKAEYKKKINDSYKYAINVSSINPYNAIKILEEVIKNSPQYEEIAQLYFLLGQLKLKHSGNFYRNFRAKDPVPNEVKEYPKEYDYFEPSEDYNYNGYHFKQLIALFPHSKLADRAAYQLPRLSVRCDCEGHIDCYIECQIKPIGISLKRYPNSTSAEKTVSQANLIFLDNLSNVMDYNTKGGYYDPARVKKLLNEYEVIANHFPNKIKVKAYLTIASLWTKFLDYDRAKKLYNFILTSATNERDKEIAKQKLSKLPTVPFILSPAQIIGYSRVYLSWSKPQTNETIKEYAVYRSIKNSTKSENTAAPTLVARVRTLKFTDMSVQPQTNYSYYVEAYTSEKKFVSNHIHCQIPSSEIIPRRILFDNVDKRLYVFGYTRSASGGVGLPEIIQVADNNTIEKRMNGALFGIEKYSFEDHKHDSFVEDIWLIDYTKQRFLTLKKSSSLVDELPVIHRAIDNIHIFQIGSELFTKTISREEDMPYYGILISISSDKKQIWVNRRAGPYSLDCNEKSQICWVGLEAGIGLYRNGTLLKDVSLAKHEFVTKIISNDSGTSAWAYLSRKGVLKNIFSSGTIGREVSVPRFAGSSHVPLIIDFKRRSIWVWEPPKKNQQAQLLKISLDTGKRLLKIPIEKFGTKYYYSLPLLSLDKATGNIWLLINNNLFKINPDGEILSKSELWPIHRNIH